MARIPESHGSLDLVVVFRIVRTACWPCIASKTFGRKGHSKSSTESDQSISKQLPSDSVVETAAAYLRLLVCHETNLELRTTIIPRLLL